MAEASNIDSRSKNLSADKSWVAKQQCAVRTASLPLWTILWSCRGDWSA